MTEDSSKLTVSKLPYPLPSGAFRKAVIPSPNPSPLKKTLKTTMMLKLLSKLFPTKQWNSGWLRKNVKEVERGYFESPDGRLTIVYKGQPGGSGAEFEYEISVDQSLANDLVAAYEYVNSSIVILPSEQATLPPDNKYKDYLRKDGTYEWKTLLFRSPAELDIAIALDSKGILFFANSRCRIQNRLGTTETKEVDFLVCHTGKMRILEIDGREFHQQSNLDYARDRLFEKNGIRTTRYTASECMSNPDAIVEEFLELFEY